MKRARVLSTICTSLALTSGAMAPEARAQVPPAGTCLARSYDAAHLAQNPQQGVAALRLWVYDAVRGDPDSRSVAIEARLADQGQARAAGAGGMTLRSDLRCEAEGGVARCFVECDGGSFALQPGPGGATDLVTEGVVIGELGACGGWVNLAENDRRTTYRLAAAPGACDDLARVHPLPEPGCYGAEADGQALRLWVHPPWEPEVDYTFPHAGGVFDLTLAGTPANADLAGTVQRFWFGCSSIDGRCRANAPEVAEGFVLTQAGADLTLSAQWLGIYSPATERYLDVTADLARFTRLARRPDADCADFEAD